MAANTKLHSSEPQEDTLSLQFLPPLLAKKKKKMAALGGDTMTGLSQVIIQTKLQISTKNTSHLY